MPKLNAALPKYRLHKASGQAIVTLNSKDFYLGTFESTASYLEYDRLTAEWLAHGRQLPSDSSLTIAELLLRYLDFANKHYIKNGKPTAEIAIIKSAMRPLKELFSRALVSDFGPKKLKAVQAILITGFTDQKGRFWRGLARPTVNARISSIKRIIAWAVSEELAPPSLAHALSTVRGLQRGRTMAPEPPPVQPVADDIVEATLPHLPSVVADMVRLQRLVGCRPGEVCNLRPCDVDRSKPVWVYTPAEHKTQHRGRQRLIFIGPKAQDILRPYLLRDANSYCLCPLDSERDRLAKKREQRKTKVQPSQVNRKKPNPKRTAGPHYTKNSYRRAVNRACELAFPLPDGVAKGSAEAKAWRKAHDWSPNRLRHTAATEIRKKFGLEAAQVVLGHSSADVTQVYAERDQGLAAKIMGEVG